MGLQTSFVRTPRCVVSSIRWLLLVSNMFRRWGSSPSVLAQHHPPAMRALSASGEKAKGPPRAAAPPLLAFLGPENSAQEQCLLARRRHQRAGLPRRPRGHARHTGPSAHPPHAKDVQEPENSGKLSVVRPPQASRAARSKRPREPYALPGAVIGSSLLSHLRAVAAQPLTGWTAARAPPSREFGLSKAYDRYNGRYLANQSRTLFPLGVQQISPWPPRP